MTILISCETGGDRAPSRLVASLRRHRGEADAGDQTPSRPAIAGPFPPELPSSLSSDVTAKYVATRMAGRLGVELIANDYSLDLIDVTRSPRHRQLFPSLTRSWPSELREALIEEVHTPYRDQVKRAISQLFVKSPYVIHLSVRSFALRSEGKLRRADAGLLYDPARDDEVDFCLDWIDEMYEEIPMLRVRRNYPRRGTTDSITKAMRDEFAGQPYLGVEVLINRAWAGRPVAIRDEVIDTMSDTLLSLTTAEYQEAA